MASLESATLNIRLALDGVRIETKRKTTNARKITLVPIAIGKEGIFLESKASTTL